MDKNGEIDAVGGAVRDGDRVGAVQDDERFPGMTMDASEALGTGIGDDNTGLGVQVHCNWYVIISVRTVVYVVASLLFGARAHGVV